MQHLQNAFARDQLTLAEFDERMELARTAGNDRELAVLLADVPGHEQTAMVLARDQLPTAPARATAMVPAGKPEQLVAIFGGVEREGRWTPAPQTRAIAVFGGIELDFCEVDLAPGSVTVVDCFALCGGVEIEVPADVHVEVGGTGFLGAFATRGRADAPPPGAPVVRVVGLAVMGGVEIKRKKPRKNRRDNRRWSRHDSD